MTEKDLTWTLETPADGAGRGLEDALVRRARTVVRCGEARFVFTTAVLERSDGGRMQSLRLALREADGGQAVRGCAGGIGAAPAPVALEAVVRPRIQAATIDGLGPLEMPALRQAARGLLRAAAAHLAGRRA